ncbi:hypothetical protein [Vallitalea okinawensis]|uniref:hypothetical protein n=1 Tax=Vallitalea okinawensis TaxID=2078660 RepID=UPI000CFB7E59|nr:hypothetical protein [Vallitalea okinawensis]
MENKIAIKDLIDTFYDIISGETETERDWDRFRTLFFANAHLMPLRFNDSNECVTTPVNVEAYILGLDRFLKSKNFYEYGLNYKIDINNNIAHVYSEYEAKISLQDKKPIKRGINLVQLIKEGNEWKILNMLWQDK